VLLKNESPEYHDTNLHQKKMSNFLHELQIARKSTSAKSHMYALYVILWMNISAFFNEIYCKMIWLKFSMKLSSLCLDDFTIKAYFM